MSRLAIQVEGVGKRYHLGEGHGHGYPTMLSERLNAAFKAPLRRLLQHNAQPEANQRGGFWALRDVSLEIRQGDMLGLIGRNGAGKSTLLKVLAQITPPTEGRITVRGRVGTLLEVGTGFHPELTGRENVYLNGAILGMRRAEIAERFDQIVEFSGIGEFLDTPVKRYSSGMYVRLAFAVAAHLEPEVLLVDEVLAVGDTEFQRKCLRKIGDVAREGRTVVFVSHNLSAVQRLCDRTVWVDGGRMMEDGPTQDVVASYLRRMGPRQLGGEADVRQTELRVGTGEVRLTHVALLDHAGIPTDQLHLGEPCSVAMTFEVREPIEEVTAEVGISTAEGIRIVTMLSSDGGEMLSLEPGSHRVCADFNLSLLPGDFTIDAGIHPPNRTFDFVERVLSFAVINVPHGDKPAYPWSTTRGMIRAPSQWTVATRVRTPSA
jgi:homopolymeric O-antigen transport system ATP-binding protein